MQIVNTGGSRSQRAVMAAVNPCRVGSMSMLSRYSNTLMLPQEYSSRGAQPLMVWVLLHPLSW